MAEPTRWTLALPYCPNGCNAHMTMDGAGDFVDHEDYADLCTRVRAIVTAYDALNAEPRIGDTAKRAAFVAAVGAARGCV